MHRVGLSLLSILCLTAASAPAQDLSRYRGYQLGMSVAAVAEEARLSPAAARPLHERPQLIQELDWLPLLQRERSPAEPEAVRMVRFTFYAGRLYQIVVTYDRNRIEGLTEADLIDAISASYGPAILVSKRIGATRPLSSGESNLGVEQTVTALWEDGDHTVSLLHNSYPTGFELRLLAKAPDLLARVATLASTRLDSLEAPQVEMERRQKQADESLAKAESARRANKPFFRF
jgi:hypothetical protein